MNTAHLKTSGMHCGSCAMNIQMTLEDLDGVVEASADYGKGTTDVQFDPSVVSLDDIIKAIEEAGYSAQVA